MATGIHMPGFKGSPPQDTSDLFGDDDDEADTNSEPDDDFEEVTVPTGGAAQKPPPEVFNVDEEDEDEDEDEDDFVSSRVNKYAPVNEANESVSRAASSSNAPPTKRRRTETPPPKQTTLPARPGNGHLPANPAAHANNPPAPPPPSGPYVPTFFNASAGRNERLAPSIIDSDPLDEFSQEVADWIHHFTQGLNPDHIEAKLGILIDKGSNARLGGLSLTECILPPNSPIDTRFESNMPLQAHKHYNGLLNKLVAQAVPGEKTRVTRDEKTKQVVACVRKKRIANLEVHSPKQGVDWRISINLEEPAPAPNGQPALTRRKDRISYTHQAFKIDLTQVTSSHAGPNQQLLHELEIEFVSAAELLRHRARRAQMGPGVNPFDDLVRVFVNNVRIMARNSS